jgi:hypothetical protein
MEVVQREKAGRSKGMKTSATVVVRVVVTAMVLVVTVERATNGNGDDRDRVWWLRPAANVKAEESDSEHADEKRGRW